MGYELVTKATDFIGTCDRIRYLNGYRDVEGEEFWNDVTESSQEISKSEFLQHVAISEDNVLDEDESIDDWLSGFDADMSYRYGFHKGSKYYYVSTLYI